ncbi:MAG: hypothetical protein PHY48_08730 [Candidatus Cloacimonetes bacterium]|nr:hypothetical protein [Candidatus Cloacimonadota bacterium]
MHTSFRVVLTTVDSSGCGDDVVHKATKDTGNNETSISHIFSTQPIQPLRRATLRSLLKLSFPLLAVSRITVSWESLKLQT